MLLKKQNNTSREFSCIQAKVSTLMSAKSYKIRKLGKICIEKINFSSSKLYLSIKKNVSPVNCSFYNKANV